MNAINIIAPYKHLGMWVFDDPRVGLVQEPFVSGTDTMIDRVVATIPGAENGFIIRLHYDVFKRVVSGTSVPFGLAAQRRMGRLVPCVGPGPRRLAVSCTPALFFGGAEDDLRPSQESPILDGASLRRGKS